MDAEIGSQSEERNDYKALLRPIHLGSLTTKQCPDSLSSPIPAKYSNITVANSDSAHDPDWLGSDSARITVQFDNFHPRSDPNHLQQPRDAFANIGWLGNQTQHEMAFAREIVKVARVHDDTHLAQEIDRQIFVGS